MSKRKNNKKKIEKVRRLQQRDTVKNLHRKVNDLEIQLYHLRGKDEAHEEEQERAVATATEQVRKKLSIVEKEAARVPELRQQLSTKDKQLQTTTNELAVVKARDAAHGEELQRVKKDTEEQVTATMTKQLEEEVKKRERAEEAKKKLQDCIDLAQQLNSLSGEEIPQKRGRGRKEEGNASLTIRIPEEIVVGIDLLEKLKILPKKEVAKAVADFLRPIIIPKAEEASKVLSPIISDDDQSAAKELDLFDLKTNNN